MVSNNEDIDFRDAFGGGCYKEDKPICVFEPQDYCDEGTFHSAHFLRANSGHPLRYCATSIQYISIGRCSDNGKCTNIASRCNDPSSFQEYDPTCSLMRDKTNGELTTYGSCNNRCVWSSEDCIDGEEEWISDNPACTSNKVEIGACMAGHTFCVVSSAMCIQPDEPYISHKEALETRKVGCFLTEDPSTTSPTISPAPTTGPTKNPTRSPFDQTNLFSANKNDVVDSTSVFSTEVIIVIVAGVTLSLLLFALLFNVITCHKLKSPKIRRRRRSKSTKEIDTASESSPEEKSEKKDGISEFI